MKPKFLPINTRVLRDPTGMHLPVGEALGAYSNEIRLLADMEGDFLSNVRSILPQCSDTTSLAPVLATMMAYHGSNEIARRGQRNLRQLAESGSNLARVNLAIQHLGGNVLEPDFAYALSLLAAVIDAEVGDPYLRGMACGVMGDCYVKGIGVEVDFAMGVQLQERAAALGVPVAAFNLGLHHEARGTSDRLADYPTAAGFYKRAVDLGHVPAMTNLGVLYLTGAVEEPERGAGWALLSGAAELGDDVAVNAMSLLAANGLPRAGNSSLGSITTRRL